MSQHQERTLEPVRIQQRMTEYLSHGHTNVQSEGLRFGEMCLPQGLAETARTPWALHIVLCCVNGMRCHRLEYVLFLAVIAAVGRGGARNKEWKESGDKHTGRLRHGQGAQSSPPPMKNPVRCSGCGQVQHPVP